MVTENKGTQQIESDRLILRRFKKTDATDMLRYWISIPDVQKNYGEPVYNSLVEVEVLLDKWITSYTNNDCYRWAIILKDSNINIGQIGFYKVNNRHRKLDVEYCIGKKFWKNGYATEALKSVIDYTFNNTMYNRIQAFHRSKNATSGLVLRKAGMKYEGTLRQSILHDNVFDDCLMYSILKEENSND